MAGVKLSKPLAIRTKRVVEQFEQDRGTGGKVPRTTAPPRRQRRKYRATEDFPAPVSETEPSSAMCTLLMFDGTEFVDTATEEKVYSCASISMGTVFNVSQIGGIPFAEDAPRKIIGVSNEEIAFGSSGEITIYRSPAPGQPAVEIPGMTITAWFDWIAEDSPEVIQANVDVSVEIAEHGGYRIYHAACEPRTR